MGIIMPNKKTVLSNGIYPNKKVFYRGVTPSTGSSVLKFDKPDGSSYKEYHSVCKLIDEGATRKYISETFGISLDRVNHMFDAYWES